MPKPARQTAPKGKSVSFAAAAPDSRFDALSTDPRYRLPSKKRTHIKLDKRLGGILKDDDFSNKASVDRYGRKVAKGQGKKELQRLYRLDSEDEEDGEQDDDKSVLAELASVERKYDPARDGGFSSSESDSSDEDDSEAESEVDAELPELADEVPMGEVSSRLAVVNLDWDNIKAEDIMSVAASFAGPDGCIVSVAVYPSEFGRERMEREETEGPPKEIFQAGDSKKQRGKANAKSELESDSAQESEPESDSSEDEAIKKQLLEEDNGAEFDSVALRKYQLDRLRYYYAVITCSSHAVAKALYDNMDGQEYLSSANFFDMRFIPDEVDFENDRPREVCKKVADNYKPSEFTTDALMHSNVKLTWDADDQKRKEVQKRAFSRKDIDENDLLAYIGSGSSSEEEEEEEGDEALASDNEEADVKSTTSRATTRQARREALRAALGLDLEPSTSRRAEKEQKHVGDMQITFIPALSSAAKSGASVFENEPLPPEETTQEKYIRKERERKALRKERMKAKRTGETEESVPETTPAIDPDKQASDDDPFNDPFFENPTAANEKSKAERRKEKHRKKQAAKDDAAQLAQSERAELELMMLDDNGGAQTSTRKHFDMRAIEKAEKQARKAEKRKGGKKQHKSAHGDDGVDRNGDAKRDGAGFDINTKDERFTKLFEDPAFAIDPTNPKFRDTKGMRTILGEKRKRGEARVASAESKGVNGGIVDGMKETAERIGKRLKAQSR